LPVWPKAAESALKKAIREQKKLATAEKKTASMQVEIAQAVQQASFTAHYNTLFESAQA
jgi:hypothetical protein